MKQLIILSMLFTLASCQKEDIIDIIQIAEPEICENVFYQYEYEITLVDVTIDWPTNNCLPALPEEGEYNYVYSIKPYYLPNDDGNLFIYTGEDLYWIFTDKYWDEQMFSVWTTMEIDETDLIVKQN